MQKYLYDNLCKDYQSEINAYGRVFKNTDKGSIKPIYYKGNGQYIELLTDSKVKGLHFFFVEDNEADVEAGTCFRSSDVDLIVIIDDITRVRGDLEHYADEEIVLNVLQYTRSGFRAFKVVKGEEALSGFDISKLQFIHPFFVFKITGKINNY